MCGNDVVCLQMVGSPYTYCAIFSSREKFDQGMKDFPDPFADVDGSKIIVEPTEFIDSMTEHQITVILNPYITAEGKVRYSVLKALP